MTSGTESSFSKPSKAKTGFSIQEIVDSASNWEAGPVAGAKRKADEFVGGDAAAASAALSKMTTTSAPDPTLDQLEQAVLETATLLKSNDAEVPTVALPALNETSPEIAEIAVVEERPAKRSRLSYAATAVAGAVVGGIGMFAALALSPEI